MGFLDNMTSAMSRGTAAAQRTGRSAQLKLRLNELMKQRRDLAAQLGASLYDATKEDASLREGREPLFDGIASIDEQRKAIEDEIAEIEAAAVASAIANTTYKCPKCGTNVAGDDLFCSGCGLPIDEVKAVPASTPAATDGRRCLECGASLADDDLFCMSCGAKAEVPEPVAEPAPEPEPVAESAPEPNSVPDPVSEPEPVAELQAEPGPVPGFVASDVPAGNPRVPAVPVPKSASESSSNRAPAPLAFCMRCGNELGPDDAFCGSCGTPVER